MLRETLKQQISAFQARAAAEEEAERLQSGHHSAQAECTPEADPSALTDTQQSGLESKAAATATSETAIAMDGSDVDPRAAAGAGPGGGLPSSAASSVLNLSMDGDSVVMEPGYGSVDAEAWRHATPGQARRDEGVPHPSTTAGAEASVNSVRTDPRSLGTPQVRTQRTVANVDPKPPSTRALDAGMSVATHASNPNPGNQPLSSPNSVADMSIYSPATTAGDRTPIAGSLHRLEWRDEDIPMSARPTMQLPHGSMSARHQRRLGADRTLTPLSGRSTQASDWIYNIPSEELRDVVLPPRSKAQPCQTPAESIAAESDTIDTSAVQQPAIATVPATGSAPPPSVDTALHQPVSAATSLELYSRTFEAKQLPLKFDQTEGSQSASPQSSAARPEGSPISNRLPLLAVKKLVRRLLMAIGRLSERVLCNIALLSVLARSPVHVMVDATTGEIEASTEGRDTDQASPGDAASTGPAPTRLDAVMRLCADTSFIYHPKVLELLQALSITGDEAARGAHWHLLAGSFLHHQGSRRSGMPSNSAEAEMKCIVQVAEGVAAPPAEGALASGSATSGTTAGIAAARPLQLALDAWVATRLQRLKFGKWPEDRRPGTGHLFAWG